MVRDVARFSAVQVGEEGHLHILSILAPVLALLASSQPVGFLCNGMYVV